MTLDAQSASLLTSVLNTLKLAGIVVGGFATVLATIKETKTPKKTLTREGKFILRLGITGLLIAFSAQIVDWEVTLAHDRAAAEMTQKTLSEIGRAVTRLESISLSVSVPFPTQSPLLKQYTAQLSNRLSDLRRENPPIGETWNGLSVQARSYNGNLTTDEIVRMPSGSVAMPDPKQDFIASEMLDLTLPYIAIYRRSDGTKFSLNKFRALELPAPTPDILLHTTDGPVVGTITLNDSDSKILLTFQRSSMVVAPDTWRLAPGVESMWDLNNAHVVVYFPRTSVDAQVLLSQTDVPGIALTINHHRILLRHLKETTLPNKMTVYECDLPSDLTN